MVDSNTKSPFRHLPSKLFTLDGEIETSKVLENELIGFYFSAHWCPPCRAFTPKLKEAYSEWKEGGNKIELVFVSSDRDEDSLKDYFKDMGWTYVGFEDKEARNGLKAEFHVTGIPKLVILSKDGKVVDGDARGSLSSLGSAAIEGWQK
mmetsp:Transcript_11394/g.11715  ORF Transcript_11394/g.11715 Transcript_11394/m.11715 type:complete len:149 (-) Transcript_11394:82-528(-)